MHYSPQLILLDISFTGLNIKSCLEIAKNGIRKSRTLLSIHMSGLDLRDTSLDLMRSALNINK